VKEPLGRQIVESLAIAAVAALVTLSLFLVVAALW
jgi:hypothetical protein